MKYLKRFNESDQPKITPDLVEDVKDIFFNCFSEEFDDHFFEWWSNDLEELDDDKFYIEITQKYWTIDLIVNSVYDIDPFGGSDKGSGSYILKKQFIARPKLKRFKKILKDEYDLEFSDNIDWDRTAALPGTYQEFFYTTYTIL